MEKTDFEKAIDKLTETEERFLEENQCLKNEHGAYVFISQCGRERIELSLFLMDYKQWLIENKIVKQL